MKRINVTFVLAAILALAGLVFAQQKSSSKPAQPQQNSATSATQDAGWWCPMAGYMNRYGAGPGWMRGNRSYKGRGTHGAMGPSQAYGPMGPGYAYGPMGPGMMDGPAAPPNANAAPQTPQTPPARSAPEKAQPKQ